MPRTIDTISDFDIEHAISHLVAENGGEPFTTIDVLRKILGAYHSDLETPVALSTNAQFGKRLSANANSYRIQLVKHHQPATDDAGNTTSTALWEAM